MKSSKPQSDTILLSLCSGLAAIAGFALVSSNLSLEIKITVTAIVTIASLNYIYQERRKERELKQNVILVFERSDYKKLYCIADKQMRPVKNQIEFIIQEYIKGYENENGAIQLENQP